MSSGNHFLHLMGSSQLQTARHWRRRDFVKGVAALAGAAGLAAYDMRSAAAESPPEIKRIRMLSSPAICGAQALVEELMLAEGFTEVEFAKQGKVRGARAIAQGLADVSMRDAPETFLALDEGVPVVFLAGIHAGCWELFVNGPLRTLRDLKGKTVAIRGYGVGDHVLLSTMLAYVGMDPHKDVNWLAGRTVTDAMPMFIEGKADAYMAFAPQPQDLRAKKIGRVILNTAQDRPWSQHYCCLAIAHREFVRAYPVATKRALRAFLKVADICSQDPERAARVMADKGVEPRYEIGLEVIKSLPYDRWRTHNPEDTLRFYALRLHEAGMIKTNPDKLIAQSTDWRFLNELKRELKA